MATVDVQLQAAMSRGLIKAMGMAAENAQRKFLGQSMAYVEDDFLNVIEEEGIGHDAVIRALSSLFNFPQE